MMSYKQTLYKFSLLFSLMLLVTLGLLQPNNVQAAGCQTLSKQTLERKAKPFETEIRNAANRYNIDANLIKAIIAVESCFVRTARGRDGEIGLMQLMPATARHFKVTNRSNAQQNIYGGTRYLSHLDRRYNGDVQRVVAAYNAGEGNVRVGRPIRNQAYVNRVMRAYRTLSGRSTPRTTPRTRPTQLVSNTNQRNRTSSNRASSQNRTTTRTNTPSARTRTGTTQAVPAVRNTPTPSAAPNRVSPQVVSASANRATSTPQRAGPLPWAEINLRQARPQAPQAQNIRVNRGQTVYAVSRQTGVPVNTLIRLNNLSEPYHLKEGQTLRVR